VRNRIWTYPPEAVLGPTLFQIPMEEVFFFVIQTYNTSILYLLLNKPTFFPTYLRAADGSSTVKDCFKIYRLIGQCFLAFLVAFGGYQVLRGGRGTYLGLILIWAVPFLFLLWYGSKPRYETGRWLIRTGLLHINLLLDYPGQVQFFQLRFLHCIFGSSIPWH
jgi:hypothetical protein